MNEKQDAIVAMVQSLLERAGKGGVEVTPTTPIHADGLGLDSLETAELSAILEDEFGSDPFGSGLLPETVAEIAAFYTADDSSEASALA